MSDKKIILGFIAGSAVGAIAGILFAPDSGANTRKKIADLTGELVDSVAGTLSGTGNKLQTKGEEQLSTR